MCVFCIRQGVYVDCMAHKVTNVVLNVYQRNSQHSLNDWVF